MLYQCAQTEGNENKMTYERGSRSLNCSIIHIPVKLLGAVRHPRRMAVRKQSPELCILFIMLKAALSIIHNADHTI